MSHKHWENPEVTGYGRLPSRPPLIPYATTTEARGGGASDRVLSLNGLWQFTRVASPERAPEGWNRKGFAARSWQRLAVPGLWTMQGQRDRPIYTNVVMPFKEEPPAVPAANPTGLYRRTFTLPAAWRGRRVVIHLGGVENCFYLYCNGHEVGFSKDSRLPAEFDLTSHLARGSNLVALKVMRWSDASHIEDQDHWWHAGIHRDIYLYCTERVFIHDVYARPQIDESLTKGSLEIDVRLGAEGRSAEGHTVEARLYEPGSNRLVWQHPPAATLDSLAFFMVIGEGNLCHLRGTVDSPRLWSAEAPALYTLVVTLRHRARILEATRLRIGFRRVEIRDRELLVNGKAVLIRGVNRHDHSDVTGKVLTEELWRKDIETMKRHNINAVRTSHYPNASRFVDLCDEYGLYVIDEANIEAHHHYSRLGRDSSWANAFLSRAVRMVERDKNHPSIIVWSVGNETGFGANQMAMIGWMRAYDPSRPIHNENAIHDQARGPNWSGNRHGSDLVCPMYPTVDSIIAFARDVDDPRPLIMAEFAHAMGNSGGNLKEYWDAVENYHGLQGGFVWEWLDHGIRRERPDGTEYWAYGGDFGEETHDGNFVCDGLCWPDRTPHSSLLEYKRVIQPVEVQRVRGLRFRILNKHDFIDLGYLTGDWELLLNGETEARGRLPALTTAPGASTRVALPGPRPPLRAGEERSVVFRFRLARGTSWAPRGHEVAVVQIPLGAKRASPLRAGGECTVRQDEEKERLVVATRRGRITFDREGLADWREGRTRFIHQGPTLNLWRAPIDNDGIKLLSGQVHKPLGRWRAAGLDRLVPQAVRRTWQSHADGSARISFRARYLAGQSRIGFVTHYDVHGDGALEVSHRFTLPTSMPDLPRVGIRLVLPPGFESLAWFGAGPHETYVDRQLSGIVARHESSVSAQYVPYIMPQDHGNHTAVRWLELADARGSSRARIRFVADGMMQASASHYPHEILTRATHTYEVRPQPRTWVSLDAAMRGVGGASCGPDTLPQYRVEPGEYELRYRIEVGGQQTR